MTCCSLRALSYTTQILLSQIEFAPPLTPILTTKKQRRAYMTPLVNPLNKQETAHYIQCI